MQLSEHKDSSLPAKKQMIVSAVISIAEMIAIRAWLPNLMA
jgi:hypothetical protein